MTMEEKPSAAELDQAKDGLAQAEETIDKEQEDAEAKLAALMQELEQIRARAEQAEKELLYAQAEFVNISRRKEEQYRADQKYAVGELVKSLLPVLDNFERALQAAEQTRNFDALLEGVRSTQRLLQDALQKVGLVPIEAVGKEFDPKLHEAIGPAESKELPPHTVAEEVQRGYMLHDRVLRPALVRVVQEKEQSEA
jgi:molecular chaperone GrpE